MCYYNLECAYNTFGDDCKMCPPNCDILPCDPDTGFCRDGKCAPGFLGYNCTVGESQYFIDLFHGENIPQAPKAQYKNVNIGFKKIH